MPKIRDRAPLSKFKKKRKSRSRRGSNLGTMGSKAIALYNKPRRHRLPNGSYLQYLQCYRNSKYEPSVFSAIFRHKQPQNVDLKQLALLK